MPRKRDYKAEYARRIARGLAEGYSRSQARGHPKVNEVNLSSEIKSVTYDPLLEQGLKSLRKGNSLTTAARNMGKSPERLRRYLTQAGVIKKQGRRWVPAKDDRRRQIAFFSEGRVRTATVTDYATASKVGRYMSAAKQFLQTNDPDYLKPFQGEGFTDLSGKTHLFETRPNVLYRLDAFDSEPFEQVYQIVM